MTEEQWLLGTDLAPMVEFLKGKTSERKQRLFSIACCRSMWAELPDEDRRVVELAERYVEGDATPADLQAAGKGYVVGGLKDQWRRAWEKHAYLDRVHDSELAYKNHIDEAWEVCAQAEHAFHRCNTVRATVLPNPLEESCTQYGWQPYTQSGQAVPAESICGTRVIENPCGLLREIFGNPFRAIDPAAAQADDKIARLAQAIYDKHQFDRLPALADALEQAGCQETRLLEHCRKESDHARGCWAVDIVLGRS